MERWDTLTHQCEQILIDGLRPGLKAVLDRLHGRGFPHEAILQMVRTACVRAGANATCYTSLGAEAYLASLPARQPRDCCG
jgi:hypothetical protein